MCLTVFIHRLARSLRETKSAICIQRYYRGYRCRIAFLYVREAVVTIQCYARGMFARSLRRRLLYQAKTIVLQRWWRGYLSRKKYRNYMKKVVYLQSCVRRMHARRQLKKLKVKDLLPCLALPCLASPRLALPSLLFVLHSYPHSSLLFSLHPFSLSFSSTPFPFTPTQFFLSTSSLSSALLHRFFFPHFFPSAFSLRSVLSIFFLVTFCANNCYISQGNNSLVPFHSIYFIQIEARSVEHFKSLNKGMENKIISLQQRLDEEVQTLKLFTNLSTKLLFSREYGLCFGQIN